MVHEAALHPTLRAARYGKNGADKFVGIWMDLLSTARHGRDPRREVTAFFARADVAAAVDAVGQEAVDEQLTDAVTLYFRTCLTDPTYTSTLFGMKRLPIEEVHSKAAHEAASVMDALEAANLKDAGSFLPRAAMIGFLDAIGPSGEELLRAAAAKRPNVARYLS